MRYYYQIRANLVFVVLALGCSNLLAQQPSLTLTEAVKIALGSNPEWEIAKDTVDAARINTRTARTSLLPSLSFSESVTRGNDPVYVFGTKLRQQIFAQSDFVPSSLNRPTPINDFNTRFAGNWTAFDSWHTQFEIHRADLLEKSASASATRSCTARSFVPVRMLV